MGSNRSRFLDRARYQRAALAWRAAELIRCHELGLPGPVTLRQEDPGTGLWDDLVEEHEDADGHRTLHAWQVKDQDTDLSPETFLDLLRSLRDRRDIACGHLLLRGTPAIRGGGELRVLGRMAERWRHDDVDGHAAFSHLNSAEAAWVEFLQGGLPARAEDVVSLVGRLHIRLGMLEEDLRDRAMTALADAHFPDPGAALKVLLGYFDDRAWAEHACTPESLLAGPLAEYVHKAPARPRRLREVRRAWLKSVINAWKATSVLPGLRDAESAGLRLEQVWVSRRLELATTAASTPTREPEKDGGPNPDGRHAVHLPPRSFAPDLPRLVGERLGRIIVVTSPAGEGKTQLLRHTQATLAEIALGDRDAPLPVLVRAGDLSAGDLASALRARGWEQAALLAGSIEPRVVLVDALDEVPAGELPQVVDRVRTLAAEPRVRGVVVTSRASHRGRFPSDTVRVRLAPWDEADIESFLSRWAQHHPEAVRVLRDSEAAQGLLHTPLTSTLSAVAASGDLDAVSSRAAVFSHVVQRLFTEWVDNRDHGGDDPVALWEAIEPHLGALAWTMLSTGRSALSRDVVQRAFRKANRHRAGKWLDWADRQVGMLVGTTDGHYEFLLRSLAEHLAGRHLAKLGVEESLTVAREPWASEVVAHAVGVLSEDGDHEQAAEIVGRLLEGWESDFSEGMLIRARHLRRVLVALRAAVELDRPPADLVEVLAKVGQAYLAEETSVWVGDRMAEALREHALVGSPVWERLRARLVSALADTRGRTEDWYRFREQNLQAWVRLLFHRDPAVRAVATGHLGSLAASPGGRLLLVALLEDAQVQSFEVPVSLQAARYLRAVPRDESFAELRPHLVARLGRAQIPGGPAAIALRPGEAPLEDLVISIRGAGIAGWDIHQELAELAAVEGAEALLDQEWPDWRKSLTLNRTSVPHRPVEGDAPPISEIVKRRIVDVLAHAATWTPEEQDVLVAHAGAAAGRDTLHILCVHARRDPEPVIALLSGEREPDGHAMSRPALRSGFRPDSQEALGLAAQVHEVLRDALLACWSWYCHEAEGFRWAYPGHALEPLVRGGDDEAERIYAEWLPHSGFFMQNVTRPLPLDLLSRPVIRAAVAEAAKEVLRWATVPAEDGTRGAPSSVAIKLLDWAPAWYDCPVFEGVLAWLREGGGREAGAAIQALSRPGVALPGVLADGTLLEACLRRLLASDEWIDRVSATGALPSLVGSPLAGTIAPFLRQIAEETTGELRMLAVAALLPYLSPEEARPLVATVAEEYPGNLPPSGQAPTAIDAIMRAHPDLFAARLDDLVESYPAIAIQVLPAMLPHLPEQHGIDVVGRLAASPVAASALPWRRHFLGFFGTARLTDLIDRHCFDAGIEPLDLPDLPEPPGSTTTSR